MTTVIQDQSSIDVGDRFAAFETVADLAAHFSVPADRIILHPLPFTATEADCIAWNQRGIGQAELVENTLVLKATMAHFEAQVATVLLGILFNWLRTHPGTGKCFDASDMQRMIGANTRSPDLSVYLRKSLLETHPDGKMGREPKVSPRSADLAIEVLSAANQNAEIQEKRIEYLASGSQIVWIIDPVAVTVEVWSADGLQQTLHRQDMLTGGALLPGFTLSIDNWFTEAETI